VVAIEVVFETRSTTVDNEQGGATGWLPGELSELGRAQARQLGQRRSGDGISAVFSSDLTRAAQTAAVARVGRTGSADGREPQRIQPADSRYQRSVRHNREANPHAGARCEAVRP
jgi:hypothetical protein